MRHLARYTSDDTGSPYDTEAPEYSIISMKPMVYLVLNTTPKYIHDPTNNILFCVYTYSVKPDIYYFPQNSYFNDSGQWGITYHEHYKVLTDKDYGVKYLLCQCVTEPT